MKTTLFRSGILAALALAAAFAIPAQAQPTEARTMTLTRTTADIDPIFLNAAGQDMTVAKKSAKKGKHAEAPAAFEVQLASLDASKAPAGKKPAAKKPAPKKKIQMASTEPQTPDDGGSGGESPATPGARRILRT